MDVKSIGFLCNKNDIVVIISSSCESKNVISAADYCNKNKHTHNIHKIKINNSLIKKNKNGLNL